MSPYKLLEYQAGNRMDLIVRYMALEELVTGGGSGVELYLRMTSERVLSRSKQLPAKLKTPDYLFGLYKDIKKTGIKVAVPVGSDYSLHNGGHRVSIALYLGKDVPVKVCADMAIHAWGLDWFRVYGFTDAEIEAIEAKYWEVLAC